MRTEDDASELIARHATDVINAAFQIGNITQNLLGEGTLSASFIPRAGGPWSRGQ